MGSGADIGREYAFEEIGLGARNATVMARLGAAAQAFFFISFLFAFFYLRALNSAGRWNAHHVHPAKAYGIPILICVLLSVGAAWLAASSLRAPGAKLWRPAMAASIVLALAAVVLQCVQYATTSFGPGEGGFASVFFGWTGLFAVNILFVAYWLTSSLTETLRPGGRALEYLRASADAIAFYWAVLGLVEVAAFILLYVVA
jgi:heme/copper-type cytochrome/quinol oxidase subunit 3